MPASPNVPLSAFLKARLLPPSMLGPMSGPPVSYAFFFRPLESRELFSLEPADELPPSPLIRPYSLDFLLPVGAWEEGPRSRFR